MPPNQNYPRLSEMSRTMKTVRQHRRLNPDQDSTQDTKRTSWGLGGEREDRQRAVPGPEGCVRSGSESLPSSDRGAPKRFTARRRVQVRSASVRAQRGGRGHVGSGHMGGGRGRRQRQVRSGVRRTCQGQLRGLPPLGMQMLQGFLGERDYVHRLGLRGLQRALDHAEALHVLRGLLRGGQKEVLQRLRWLREQGQVGSLLRRQVRRALRGDDADSLAGARHEVDVVYRIGDEKLDFLLSGGRELIRLQLENIPDLLGVRTAGGI